MTCPLVNQDGSRPLFHLLRDQAVHPGDCLDGGAIRDKAL